MAQPPPTPPSSSSPAPDDELARRLAALKAGADPGSFEPPALSGEVVDGTGPARAPRAGGSAAPRPAAARGPGAPPPGLRVRAVSWGITQAGAGRLGLRIGLALVAFGGYLVAATFVPGIALLGSVALAIIGCGLVGWHLAGRAGAWAVHAGVVLGGFGIARVIAELAHLPPAGWGTLGAGVGLLLIALVRATRGEGVRWQAWVGGGLALFGGWGALGAVFPGFPTLGDLIVPVVLVLIGVAVLRRGFRAG